MAQNSLLIQDGTGAEVLTRANGALEALQTQSSGDLAPASFKQQQVWADTSKKMLRRRSASNTSWTPVASISDTLARVGGATSTITESDFGLSVYCDGTYTQKVVSTSATFVGWHCDVVNVGSGVVTLSATSATIDGQAAVTLKVGESAKLKCQASGKYILQRYVASNKPTDGTSVGTIIMYAGRVVPDGYLECGREYRKTDYPALYATIGDSGYSDYTNPPYASDNLMFMATPGPKISTAYDKFFYCIKY